MKYWILIGLLLVSIVYSAPAVTFYSQVPADLSSVNIFGVPMNITYNITDGTGLNQTSPIIYAQTNSTVTDCLSVANGSSQNCGFQTTVFTSNVSDLWLFRLMDNQVYPANYNWPNERALELSTKSYFSLTSTNQEVLIELLNVSSINQYGQFEIYASKISGTSGMSVFYCNSTYNKVANPTGNANCINFGTITSTAPFNHSHSAYSYHHVLPFAMNTTSGKLGTVIVSPKSFFVVRKSTSSGQWFVYYINNLTRVNATMSRDRPDPFTNQAVTVDSHLHQYDGNETLCYYACANNTAGAQTCSSTRCDLIDLGGMPPVPPEVYYPTIGTYNGSIDINYTQAVSPNAYPIVKYNISLYSSSLNYIQTITSNNGLNLSYVWNSAVVSDGVYFIGVEACDNQNLCSFGYSDELNFDNHPDSVPEFSFFTLLLAVIGGLFVVFLTRRA